MPLFHLAARLSALALTLGLLGGCASISRGVAEAVLERKVEDKRECSIAGPSFDGIRQGMNRQNQSPGVTKVLMVHGIGTHLPGYSNRFRERITEALGLNITDAVFKTIAITSDNVKPLRGTAAPDLGELRVTKHTNAAGDKVLLFYELTWANITVRQKELIAYDSANTDGLKRAGINNSLKSFMNSTVPDMLIYMGSGQPLITASVKESVCWMLGNRWSDLPQSGAHACLSWPQTDFTRMSNDNYFFITHSLGSLITIDTIQSFARQTPDGLHDRDVAKIKALLKDKAFTVFMLANQLPLLELGRTAQDNTNRLDEFCGPAAPRANERIMGQLNMVAFSDPNDILSYSVREDFARDNINSRICTNLINVSLNVAYEKDVFGATTFADPLRAHSGYLEDERVISLIADGMSAARQDGTAGQRCKWQEIRHITE